MYILDIIGYTVVHCSFSYSCITLAIVAYSGLLQQLVEVNCAITLLMRVGVRRLYTGALGVEKNDANLPTQKHNIKLLDFLIH
jgi:hypothetical protein